MKALIDELADVDWRDPAWWALLGAAHLAEGWASLRRTPTTYLSSDAEPSGDTFMGWPSPPPRDLADAIASAITSALAASQALADLDGTLPDQPLRVAISTGAAATLVPATSHACFLLGPHRHTARIPDDPVALSRALAALRWDPPVGGIHRPVGSTGRWDPPLAVAIGDHAIGIARHLHRRAWSVAGGPWLGIGQAGELALASTSHLVVDGFGHAEIARRIASRDRSLEPALAAAARAICGDAPVPALPPLAAATPLDVAHRRVARLPRFAPMAYELGRLLHAPGKRFSPTIQVPVAPGAPDDPDRFKRRVVTALLSVRFADDGTPEPLDAFAARAHAAIAREAAGAGLLSRLLAATAALPIPLALKRHGLVGKRSPRFQGPIEVLAGRSSLSILRVPAGPSLVAVSSPGLVLPPDDPRSTSVITAVIDPDGATVTVASTGGEPAAALLDRYLATLARPASGSAGAGASRSDPSW